MRVTGVRGVGLAVTLLLSSCGFPADDAAEHIGNERLPDALQTDQSEPLATANATEAATVWLIDGDQLVAARHRVAAPASVESIINDLLNGPTEAEQARGLRSAVPDPSVIDGVTLARGTATVAVTGSFADIPTADQLFAVGQLVLTLTDSRGVGSVEFSRDGAVIAVPLPSGETSESPVYRDQYLSLRDPPVATTGN